MSLASQLFSMKREASGEGLLFYHSSGDIHPTNLIRHEETPCKEIASPSQKRRASREQLTSQGRQLFNQRRRADRRREREEELSLTRVPTKTSSSKFEDDVA